MKWLNNFTMALAMRIAEIGSYTPILGYSSYLTFATGNLMNLKIHCVVNAQKLAKVESSTPEGDAISLIATAISSIVTIIILAVGLLLIVPLQVLRPTVWQDIF